MKNFLPRRFGKSKAESTAEKASEIPSFEPVNALERLLILAATDPSARPAFQHALMEAQLFVITDTPSEEREYVTTVEEQISIRHIATPTGPLVAAVFTSQESLSQTLDAPAGYVSMNGRELLNIVSTIGAWLNPHSPYSLRWSPEDLAQMLGKPVSWTAVKVTALTLGEPANHPTELVDYLTRALNQEPAITSAWLALAHWPKGDQFSWYLDVRSTLGSDALHQLLPDLGSFLGPTGLRLDIALNASNDSEGTGIRISPRALH